MVEKDDIKTKIICKDCLNIPLLGIEFLSDSKKISDILLCK